MSDPSTINEAPAICSAASRRKPPWKTDNLLRTRCSTGESNCQECSKAARKLRCRGAILRADQKFKELLVGNQPNQCQNDGDGQHSNRERDAHASPPQVRRSHGLEDDAFEREAQIRNEVSNVVPSRT